WRRWRWWWQRSGRQPATVDAAPATQNDERIERRASTQTQVRSTVETRRADDLHVHVAGTCRDQPLGRIRPPRGPRREIVGGQREIGRVDHRRVRRAMLVEFDGLDLSDDRAERGVPE